MSRKNHRKGPWIPRFPRSDIRPVRMHGVGEAFTVTSDRRIGVRIDGCAPEDPAVFWIDETHVYCRANWGNWFPVRVSEPGHFRMIKRSRLCDLHQMQIETQDSREYQARVFHVEALPGKLFAPAGPDGEEDGEGMYGERLREATIQRLADEIDAFGPVDPMSFKHMEMPGVPALDLVASSDEKNVLFAVHPPETDPGFETGVDFEPGEDDSLYDPVAFPETIQRLLRQRKPLKECFDDAEVVLAVYDYPFMLERIRRNWGTEIDAEGIELVCESDFKAFLHKHFVEECGKP